MDSKWTTITKWLLSIGSLGCITPVIWFQVKAVNVNAMSWYKPLWLQWPVITALLVVFELGILGIAFFLWPRKT